MKERERRMELARRFGDAFIQRRDMFPLQMPEGHYFTRHEPLTDDHIQGHLQGDLTLGGYILNAESMARFAVLDSDDDEQFEKLMKVSGRLESEGIPNYLELSRRGGHQWFFFEEPVSGSLARAFLKGIVAEHDLGTTEIYPKQDELVDGPGSLIRLPFGVHRKTLHRYWFINPDGTPLKQTFKEQMQELLEPMKVSLNWLERYKVAEPVKERKMRAGYENIRSLPLVEFIGQYVELTPTASGFVGKCPFHDDEHRSFGINVKGNYWHCFAEEISGDIIGFWMRYRGISFREAVEELENGRDTHAP